MELYDVVTQPQNQRELRHLDQMLDQDTDQRYSLLHQSLLAVHLGSLVTVLGQIVDYLGEEV